MISDLRLCVRQIAKNPLFALVAILSLGLGIGATTSVFTVVNSTLLRPLPYRDPSRLVFITADHAAGGASNASVTSPQFDGWEKQAQSFEGLAAYDWTFTFLVHPDGNESVEGLRASAQLFSVLGLQPYLGRVFSSEEKDVQQNHVVILGYELWQRRFGGDPSLVGKTIQLNQLPPVTVIGIMPPGVRFLPARGSDQAPNYNLNAFVDFWIPATAVPTRAGRWNVVARLKAGTSLGQARAEMKSIAAVQAHDTPALNGLTAAVTPIGEVLDGQIRQVVLPLFGAVCFVLFIAIGNVTGLFIVRGLSRQKELAVRIALGANWRQLLRLTLAESFTISALGGILGVVFALAATRLLLLFAPASIPRLDGVGIDWSVLAFAAAMSVLTGLTSGVLTAWQVARPDVNHALRAGSGGGRQGRAGRRLLASLVTGEVALTLMLLIGAGLMMKTMISLLRVNPGYETSQIVSMSVTSLSPNVIGFHQEAIRKLSALPGVSAAAFVWGLPLTGNFWRAPIAIEGRPPPTNPQDRIFAPLRAVTPDYFRVMGIALQNGRTFTDRDVSNAPRVALINEEMARRYFPHEDPLGKHVTIDGGKPNPMEIVGVVADLRSRALNAPLDAEIYLPFYQAPAFSKHLVLRAQVDPMSLVEPIRRVLKTVDAGVVIENVKSMDRIRNDSISAQRFALLLIAAFSAAALLLAIGGIYGVMSHTVLQRSHEIGIRVAIGAGKSDILRLILGHGFSLAMIGITFGLAGAAALTRVLHSLLFNANPIDPATFAVTSLLLVGVILIACWLPAQRATKIDPLKVLRSE